MKISRKYRKPSCLWILPAFPYPPNSGGDIRAYYLLRHLSNIFDISIITYTWGEPLKSDVEALITETGVKEIHYVTSKRRGIVSRAFWHGAPHRTNYFIEPNMAAKLQELNRHRHYDFVQAECLYTLQYTKYFLHTPVFLTEYDLMHVKYKRWYETTERPLLYHLQLRYILRLESSLQKMTRAVFCASAYDQKLLTKMNPGHHIYVVPNGVEIEEFDQIRKEIPSNKKLLFVGSMFYKPNQDAVLFFLRDIFPKIVHDWPECQFSVVGKRASQQIESSADDKRVFVTGTVEDVRPYLAKANAVVVPLLCGSGTRIKILEAMAAGRPVVSTSIGAEGLDARHSKEILIADTPDSFATAISRLFSDSEFAHRISESGKKMVRHKYTWKRSAEIMASVYKRFGIV